LIPTIAHFNIGSPDDYRVPDGGLHRTRTWGTYAPSAALILEIVSPGDETWNKLPFYAAHQVDELLIVDPQKPTVDWLALEHDEYQPIDHSRLIAVSSVDLAEQIDWPAVDPGAAIARTLRPGRQVTRAPEVTAPMSKHVRGLSGVLRGPGERDADCAQHDVGEHGRRTERESRRPLSRARNFLDACIGGQRVSPGAALGRHRPDRAPRLHSRESHRRGARFDRDESTSDRALVRTTGADAGRRARNWAIASVRRPES
jgi:hypothetical protein